MVLAAAASETEHPVESAEAPTELAAGTSRAEAPAIATLSEAVPGGRDLTAQAHARAAAAALIAGHLEAAASVAAVGALEVEVAGLEAVVAVADKVQGSSQT